MALIALRCTLAIVILASSIRHFSNAESLGHCAQEDGSDGFLCSSGECISPDWKCDGGKDCNDGSDETTDVCGANCENVSDGGFACANGQCVSASFKCNGMKNCEDGTDENTEICEAECEKKTVSGEGFKCASGQCIEARRICDGRKDCDDGSDETTGWQFNRFFGMRFHLKIYLGVKFKR